MHDLEKYERQLKQQTRSFAIGWAILIIGTIIVLAVIALALPESPRESATVPPPSARSSTPVNITLADGSTWSYSGRAPLSEAGLQALGRAAPLVDEDYFFRTSAQPIAIEAWYHQSFRHNESMRACVETAIGPEAHPVDIALAKCEEQIAPPIVTHDN